MIYKAIKYLYYRIYDWNLRAWGESDLPQYNAIIGISFFIWLNLITVVIAIEALIKSEYLVSIPNSEYYAGAILLTLILMNCFLLVRNGKYLTIAEEFKKENPSQKRKRLILIWLYIVGSFVLNLFFVWLAY